MEDMFRDPIMMSQMMARRDSLERKQSSETWQFPLVYLPMKEKAKHERKLLLGDFEESIFLK